MRRGRKWSWVCGADGVARSPPAPFHGQHLLYLKSEVRNRPRFTWLPFLQPTLVFYSVTAAASFHPRGDFLD